MNNIFQIFLCKEKYREDNLKDYDEFFTNVRKNMLDIYPDYQYNLYTNVEAAKFVKSFSPEVYKAYWRLTPFAYRADLLRLCLLYEYGGWYFDLTTRPLFKFEPDKDFISKNDAPYYTNVSLGGLLENFVLYAKPKSKFLEMCIQQILDNVLASRYFLGLSDPHLRISGPLLIADVFGKHTYLHDTVTVGVFNHTIQSIVIDNKIFAEHKNKDPQGPSSPPRVYVPGLRHLGFKGVNNYTELYSLRAAYVNPRVIGVIRKFTDVDVINYA